MPYIDRETKDALLHGEITPQNAGQLNYVITKKILEFLKTKGESYQAFNDVLGVLTATPLELYRRRIAYYEDKKIKDNGDVYE